MPSKYKSKLPKPISKQGEHSTKLLYERCTNCGRKAPLKEGAMQYSKCSCGGTFQKYGVEEFETKLNAEDCIDDFVVIHWAVAERV
jgi:hypothetical protein